MNEADEAITRGSGNVFADLGDADADGMVRVCESGAFRTNL